MFQCHSNEDHTNHSDPLSKVTHALTHQGVHYVAHKIEHAMSDGITNKFQAKLMGKYGAHPFKWAYHGLSYANKLASYHGAKGSEWSAAAEMISECAVWELIGKLPPLLSIPIVSGYMIGHLGKPLIPSLEKSATMIEEYHYKQAQSLPDYQRMIYEADESPSNFRVAANFFKILAKEADGIDKTMEFVNHTLDPHHTIPIETAVSFSTPLPIFDIRNLQLNDIAFTQNINFQDVSAIPLFDPIEMKSSGVPIVDSTCPRNSSSASASQHAFKLPPPPQPDSLAKSLDKITQGIQITGGSTGIMISCALGGGPVGWIVGGAALAGGYLIGKLFQTNQKREARKVIERIGKLNNIVQPIEVRGNTIIQDYNNSLDIDDSSQRIKTQEDISNRALNLINDLDKNLEKKHGIDYHAGKAKKHGGDLQPYEDAKTDFLEMKTELKLIQDYIAINKMSIDTLEYEIRKNNSLEREVVLNDTYADKCFEKIKDGIKPFENNQALLLFCNQGLEKSQNHPGLLMMRTAILVKQDPKQAEADCNTLISIDKNNILPYVYQLQIQLDSQEFGKAFDTYTQLEKIKTESSTLSLDLPTIEAMMKSQVTQFAFQLINKNESTQAFELMSNPLYRMNDSDLFLLKGYDFLQKQQTKNAVETFKNVLNENADNKMAKDFLIHSLKVLTNESVKAKEYDLLAEIFQELRELEPNNKSTILNIGKAYQAGEHFEKAKEFFEKELVLDPENNEQKEAKAEVDHKITDCWVGITLGGLSIAKDLFEFFTNQSSSNLENDAFQPLVIPHYTPTPILSGGELNLDCTRFIELSHLQNTTVSQQQINNYQSSTYRGQLSFFCDETYTQNENHSQDNDNPNQVIRHEQSTYRGQLSFFCDETYSQNEIHSQRNDNPNQVIRHEQSTYGGQLSFFRDETYSQNEIHSQGNDNPNQVINHEQ